MRMFDMSGKTAASDYVSGTILTVDGRWMGR